MEEIWKSIIGYEGIYEVSNLGNVKSLKCGREKILKPVPNLSGYLKFTLVKDKIKTTITGHKLVAIAFLNHVPQANGLIIDHKYGNRSDNRAKNLRLVSRRDNVSTCFRKDKDTKSSKSVGVSRSKRDMKWKAQIQINGRYEYLGFFATEIEASTAYQNALTTIKN